MADRARNHAGLGKAVALNVITPMNRRATWVVKALLWYFDKFKASQKIAQQLSFLPFVHWVVVSRNEFPFLEEDQKPENLHYDYLFFMSIFNGPWNPYIDAFSDVLASALDVVWFWSVGYPGARPVTPLKAYITHNQIESDHFYSAYPGASVRDVRAALNLTNALSAFADSATRLRPEQFAAEYARLLLRVQHCLARFSPQPNIDDTDAASGRDPA